ncbi:MAG: 3-oxoacyl-ACP synthase [Dethiosulfovibrio peptidovorans]|nr:MAG: 3-oxoacyl-ACP synthase [Dethiosulfovibrio peptidovorans]
MSRLQGRPVFVRSTGIAVPRRVLDNHDLAELVDTSDQWIVERTGIRRRHIASEDENASDLALEACRQTLKACDTDPESVDMIVVGTNSPDTLFPSVACRVQGALGAVRAGAFDLQAGCTGSVYALSLASSGIASGLWNRVLVCGVEVISRLIDWNDRGTCVLFGDGAGAVLLEAGEAPGVLACDMRADGTKWDHIVLPGGMSSRPASSDTVSQRDHYVSMRGNDVFKFTQRVLPSYLRGVCEELGVAVGDVDRWVLHQANMRIVSGVLRRLGVPEERGIHNLERYGNTSAASVFIALDEAYREGSILRGQGQTVVVASFGAGMTYGAWVYRS